MEKKILEKKEENPIKKEPKRQYDHRATLVKKIDSLSSTHLKINLSLNFIMIALTLLIVMIMPFLSL